MPVTSVNALAIGEEYLKAWKDKDLNTLSRLVHPQIQLKSPITEVTGKEEFLRTCERIMANLDDVRVQARFSSDSRAMFLYEFMLKPPLGSVKTANLMTVERDKIRSVELIFDARPFENQR